MKIILLFFLIITATSNAVTVFFNPTTFLSKNDTLPKTVAYDSQLDDMVSTGYDYSLIENYSRNFSFEIIGLNQGTGTLDQLSALIGSNQVTLNFNLDGNLYSTNSSSEYTNNPSIDNDLSINIEGSDSYYILDQEGFSINYSPSTDTTSQIFEVYGFEVPLIHQYISNDQGYVPFALLSNGGEYIQISTNENLNEFTVFYEAVPEPSTYALIFGAVALGFAISRRK
ncbi:MAG: PEP-CTERM sorting domain-containing protein [Verrucomicrobiota bacterium]|nr:PEP-CTERM sorting domain-containing protein [Verrucomicrobiota bacterium]